MDRRFREQPEFTADEKAGHLISAIFHQALADACCYRRPRSPEMIAKRNKKPITHKISNFLERERLSYEARQFINKNNPSFAIYCDAAGLDREYMEKKLWQQIHKKDQEL